MSNNTLDEVVGMAIDDVVPFTAPDLVTSAAAASSMATAPMDCKPSAEMEGPIFPTPKDFAEAVFPNIVVGKNHRDCIDTIIKKLKAYNCFACTLSSATSLTAIRKLEPGFAKSHAQWSSKRIANYLYCENCLNNTPDAKKFHLSVVATLSYKEQNNDATVKVLAVYPHPSQCNLALTSRRNYKIDKENKGLGWETLDFELGDIVGDTYSKFVQILRCTKINEDHGGKYNNVYICSHP